MRQIKPSVAFAAGLTLGRAAGKVWRKQGSHDLDHSDPRQ